MMIASNERYKSQYELRRMPERESQRCVWCDEWLTWDPPADMNDPKQVGDWHVDGDYGCDDAPDTTEDGVGGHLTVADLAAIVRSEAGA